MLLKQILLLLNLLLDLVYLEPKIMMISQKVIPFQTPSSQMVQKKKLQRKSKVAYLVVSNLKLISPVYFQSQQVLNHLTEASLESSKQLQEPLKNQKSLQSFFRIKKNPKILQVQAYFSLLKMKNLKILQPSISHLDLKLKTL